MPEWLSRVNSGLAVVMSSLAVLAEYALRCVLLVIEIAILLGLFPGLPGTMAYFAWVTHERLWPVLDGTELAHEAREVFAYLIFDAIFLTALIWGIIPYFSIPKASYNRWLSYASGTFNVLVLAFITLSLRAAVLTCMWGRKFQSTASLSPFARQRQANSIFLSTLLFLGYSLALILLVYTARFGLPSLIRQMLNETRELLHHVGVEEKKHRRKG